MSEHKIRFNFEDIEAGRKAMQGFCIECGSMREMCEPDARNYPCDECGEDAVYGAEEILIMRLVDNVDDLGGW